VWKNLHERSNELIVAVVSMHSTSQVVCSLPQAKNYC